MILTLSEVSEFKNNIKEHFSVDVHFHDGCGGQYFSLDKIDDELKNYILQYYADKNMRALFSNDSLQFTVEKIDNVYRSNI